MTKISSLTTKGTPVGADLVNGLDSADSNPQTNNKNFSLDSIGSLAFSSKSTSDLPEGANLYYTEAKVTANTTVVGLGNTKSDKTNVLELDNTTPFTPTADFEPATKKYVDDIPVPSASESAEGVAFISTAALASGGVDDLTIMTPKKVGDNYTTKTSAIEGTFIMNSSSPGTFNIAHGLSVIPKKLTFYFSVVGIYIPGTYCNDGGNISEKGMNINNTGTSLVGFGNFIYRRDTSGTPGFFVSITVDSIDSTNVVLQRNVGGTNFTTNIDFIMISEL